MNRPQFNKGDVIVHTNTGIVCVVKRVRRNQTEHFNILVDSHRGRSEWMSSQYFTLKTIFDSPLMKALK